MSISVGLLGNDAGFYVADDGPGIPGGRHEQVFEPDYTTSTDGTGFGLSIVEEIADAHGWRVSVATSDDGGARFDIHGAQPVDQELPPRFVSTFRYGPASLL